MLALLSPKQVTDFWPVIKKAVEMSRPPHVGDGPDRDNNILEALLSNEMHCWGDFTLNGEDSVLNLILLTTFTHDRCAGVRSLLIYSIYGYRMISPKAWAAGLAKLKKWAVANHCTKVTAYTDSPRVLEIVEQLGGDSSYRLISFDCGK